jgi:phosphoribosyl-AMP cyclohydrolase / phosphoribosyl-ATP pyrophosphohydrolase
MIIPSIDLMDGKAVQLKQGKEKILERGNIIELAKDFGRYGEVAVIDLDAALAKGDNLDLVKNICKIADCRVGGGIRSLEKANELLTAGAKKIIIGTKANKEFLKNLPKERIVVAIDTKDGFVVNKGWTNKTKKKPKDVILELEGYCSEFLFTNVNKEGMMKGLDFKIVESLRSLTKNKITVAGGITTNEDILKLEGLGVNSQIGMALYTGKIKLDKAFVSILDFDKCDGLVPTIVQDNSGQVLMLAYSSKDSLLESFGKRRATYYSRSRERLWTKGETSGNFQELITVKYDCDKDCLLFIVKQNNVACHEGKYSCFGNRNFGLGELYEVICDRIENGNKESYTAKISANEQEIKKKIVEEANEVVNYTSKDNLVWEIADLMYFVIVIMAKNEVLLDNVINELSRRKK